MPGEPLRVMVVARLFSGLVESLDTGQWQPRGVPAIYKLLEALADDPEVEPLFVFACKDAEAGARVAGRRAVEVDRLGGRVLILPYRRHPWLAALGLDGKLRELNHLLRCLWIYARFRPAVSYFTNANFAAAGIFARLGLGRMILRFMGLHPEQKRLAEARGGLQRWLYQAPFDHVICTQEGSGAEYYLPRLLRPGTPLLIPLNGVDRRSVDPAAVAAIRRRLGRDKRPLVLFIGRLEANKGCDEFVTAMITLLRARPGAARAAVVGTGSQYEALAARVNAEGMAGDILLTGAIPHSEVGAYLHLASIYVSLNQFGNLSNANLEAIVAGKCMILPEADPATHTDEITERLLPRDVIARLARDDLVGGLVKVLRELLDRPQEIARRAAATTALGHRLLDSWDARIATEMAIIRGNSSGAAVPVAPGCATGKTRRRASVPGRTPVKIRRSTS